MEENKTTKFGKKGLFGVLALVAVIAVFAAVYFGFREKPVEGAKAVTIEVVNNENETKTYEVHTDELYLRAVLEQTKGLEVSGNESDFGLMILYVNGLRADYVEDGAYWAVYVDGEYGRHSVDEQPVEDGDVFTLKYELAQ